MATTAVVAAVRLGSYLQAVWESKVALLKEDLSLAWSAEHSMNTGIKLVVSNEQIRRAEMHAISGWA
eukprot:286991-Prymnesium_polylepis.1